GEREIARLTEEAASDDEDRAASALAALVSANRATEAERQRALAMVRSAQEELATLGEEDLERRAELVDRIQQIEGAFERARKEDPAAARERERALTSLRGMVAAQRELDRATEGKNFLVIPS